MSIDNYDEITAFHYAAYRPPLHEKILSLAIPHDLKFNRGLDIGSGTGYSASALSAYCDQVIGLEPSDEMRTLATPHPSVRYIEGSGESIPFTSELFDIVTLAGSLFYIDKTKLLAELNRVCRKSACIIVYDFELDLTAALSFFGLKSGPRDSASNHNYDHEINLSSCDELRKTGGLNDKILLSLTHSELAHILLSSSERFQAIKKVHTSNDLHSEIENKLSFHNFSTVLSVNIFSSSYTFR